MLLETVLKSIINGPDSLIVTDNSDIDWDNMYTVDDFTPNLDIEMKTVFFVTKANRHVIILSVI